MYIYENEWRTFAISLSNMEFHTVRTQFELRQAFATF